MNDTNGAVPSIALESDQSLEKVISGKSEQTLKE